jgi:hypothetical protein
VCTEASAVLRAVAADFFFDCWCFEEIHEVKLSPCLTIKYHAVKAFRVVDVKGKKTYVVGEGAEEGGAMRKVKLKGEK